MRILRNLSVQLFIERLWATILRYVDNATKIIPRFTSTYVMLCAIWYHLYNLKTLKNTHGGVLLLVKLQSEACNFTRKLTLPYKCFLNYINGTKSSRASHFFLCSYFSIYSCPYFLSLITISSTSSFLELVRCF